MSDVTFKRLIGLAGWSGSGKTTLAAKLIPALAGRGLKVSTIKHAHHDFDIDQPGKDSWVHRQAGAIEVLISSNNRYALIHELRSAPEPGLAELIAKLSPADIVIVEGFRGEPHTKIEIFRPELGKSFLYPNDPMVLAVASPEPIKELTIPWLPLNDPESIARFILASQLTEMT